MMESMALAEAIYRSRSRRLLRVLSVGATLLLAVAVWVAVSGESHPSAEAPPVQDCDLAPPATVWRA